MFNSKSSKFLLRRVKKLLQMDWSVLPFRADPKPATNRHNIVSTRVRSYPPPDAKVCVMCSLGPLAWKCRESREAEDIRLNVWGGNRG